MGAETQDKYMTKKVSINGQTVTLYSSNGITWLSSPDEVEQVMTRLENTRVTLAEGKVGDSISALKPTSPRFRPKLKKYPQRNTADSNEKLDQMVDQAKTLPIPALQAKPKEKVVVEKAPKEIKAKAKPAPKKAAPKKAAPKKAAPKKKSKK